jgi:hypothetical protein
LLGSGAGQLRPASLGPIEECRVARQPTASPQSLAPAQWECVRWARCV